MSIEEHLLTDEKILAECSEVDFIFYVTNKRILKHKMGSGIFSKETLHDISFREITSVSLEIKRRSAAAVVSGIVLIFIGFFGLFLRDFFLSNLFELFLRDFFPTWFLQSGLMFMLLIIGIIAIIYGMLHKESWFQFKGPGLLTLDKESKIWRLKEVSKPDVRKFIRTVREELSSRD